jgi:methionyl-tRNA synthetase
MAAVFKLIDATNEFIAEAEPWVLARHDAASGRLDQVLFDAAEALRIAAVLLLPVMPASCAEILRRTGEPDAANSLRLDRDAAWKRTLARRLTRGPSIWPRLEEREATMTAGSAGKEPHVSNNLTPSGLPPGTGGDAEASHSTDAAPIDGAGAPATAPDDRLSIDEFLRLDLRVAKVTAAERVPKSKKLLKLQIDLGGQQRTLVAGIAESYEPDGLVGRTVAIVANLKPATLMGIESNGMVLAASTEGGKAELVSFVNPPPPGSRIR